jgi:hypothetical protein
VSDGFVELVGSCLAEARDGSRAQTKGSFRRWKPRSRYQATASGEVTIDNVV